jgi:hypothetical protein
MRKSIAIVVFHNLGNPFFPMTYKRLPVDMFKKKEKRYHRGELGSKKLLIPRNRRTNRKMIAMLK